MKNIFLLPFLVIWTITCFRTTYQLDIVYAVNCGGNAHTDSNGISYEKDPTTQGTLGPPWAGVRGISTNDVYLYRTFRYSNDVLSYDLPLTGDGWYGLLLHLADDSSPTTVRRHVQVQLNGQHILLEDLDFYADCGYNTACNQIFYFKVCKKTLHYAGQSSTLWNEKKVVVTIRNLAVNALINGILLVKGKLGEGLPIVGTKTVFYFDMKNKVKCEGPEEAVNCVTQIVVNYDK
jgi:Malectin domain